jgi:hypothetical protein
MITLGFTYEYSDLAVNDVPFPFISTYLYVQTAGDIVYESPNGSAQWLQAAGVGYHPISAIKILTSGTVNGTPRVTSAGGIVYCCAPRY